MKLFLSSIRSAVIFHLQWIMLSLARVCSRKALVVWRSELQSTGEAPYQVTPTWFHPFQFPYSFVWFDWVSSSCDYSTCAYSKDSNNICLVYPMDHHNVRKPASIMPCVQTFIRKITWLAGMCFSGGGGTQKQNADCTCWISLLDIIKGKPSSSLCLILADTNWWPLNQRRADLSKLHFREIPIFYHLSSDDFNIHNSFPILPSWKVHFCLKIELILHKLTKICPASPTNQQIRSLTSDCSHQGLQTSLLFHFPGSVFLVKQHPMKHGYFPHMILLLILAKSTASVN